MEVDSKVFGARIKQIREEKGYSVRQLAMQSDMSPSYISLIENGYRSMPTNKTLYKIAKGLRISNNEILELAGIINDVPSNAINIGGSEAYELPIYGRISAGYPQGAKEDIDGSVNVDEELVRRYGKENLLALRIDGESMNKVIPNGAVAILAKTDSADIANGDICGVIINGDSATLKHVYQYPDRIRFEPDSWLSDFKPFEYKRTDIENNEPPVEIIGKLVQMSAKF